jgi:hypothetical protein
MLRITGKELANLQRTKGCCASQVLAPSIKSGASAFTAATLNAVLDELAMADKASRKVKLKSLVVRLPPSELQLTLRVILQQRKGHGMGLSLMYWLRWMHPDAPKVHESCDCPVSFICVFLAARRMLQSHLVVHLPPSK